MAKMAGALILSALASMLISCGSSSIYSSANIYSLMEDLYIEVAYEEGAEPYTETIISREYLWDVLEINMKALFAGKSIPPKINIPKSIDEMTKIVDQKKESFTAEEIISLADEYKKGASNSKSVYFLVIFLEGYFQADSGEIKYKTMGTSINGTGVIAIFKPVIRISEVLDPTIVTKFIEQSTIIHEMGHALGLVGNGVSVLADHWDQEHGNHCKNNDCVMYWLNEGAESLTDFIQHFQDSGNIIMFCEDCLNDTESYAESF